MLENYFFRIDYVAMMKFAAPAAVQESAEEVA
jgi:hypothetical protein